MGIKIGNIDISKIKIASGLTPRLPSAYQEVEYIQSSGTQWIDTGLYANQNTVVETKWNLVQYNSNVSYDKFYGTYGSNGSRCFFLQSNKPDDYKIRTVNYSNSSSTRKIDSLSAITTGTDYTVKHSVTEFWLNGVLQGSCSTISYTSPSTITIFALHSGSSVMQNVYLKLYYFKMYSGTTLERDFVPCYRKSDSVIGLYDLVNDVFYTNSGTGTFTKGEDVNLLYKEIKKVYKGSTQVRPDSARIMSYDFTQSDYGFAINSSWGGAQGRDSNGFYKISDASWGSGVSIGMPASLIAIGTPKMIKIHGGNLTTGAGVGISQSVDTNFVRIFGSINISSSWGTPNNTAVSPNSEDVLVIDFDNEIVYMESSPSTTATIYPSTILTLWTNNTLNLCLLSPNNNNYGYLRKAEFYF